MNGPSTLLLQGLQIIWINVLLSGDNAVVIALACRSLADRQRRRAIAIGSVAAVVLQISFTFFVVEMLRLPWLKLGCGLLLLVIAARLVRTGRDPAPITPSGTIWGAVRTIALADAVMSLDNVVAVAAAARNSIPLIVFGVVLSVPLVVFGSTLILMVLRRFPVVVIAGGALLGWVGGEMIASEPRVAAVFATLTSHLDAWVGGVCAALVLLLSVVGGRRPVDETPAD